MSARNRKRDSRRGSRDPFAWFPTDVLLGAAVALTAEGLAVWLALNANWDFRTVRGVEGRTSLSDRQGKAMLRLGKAGLDRGRQEVLALGLAVERQAATHPGGPGGALGRTAIYDLPHRHRGQPPPRLALPAGIKRPAAHIRYNVNRLRDDLRRVKGDALRVFIYALAKHDRTRDAELASSAPFELSVAELAGNLKMRPSTAAAAMAAAIGAGMLVEEREAAGRAPRLVRLPFHHWAHERRHARPDTLPLVSTIDPGSGGYEGKTGQTDPSSGCYGS